MHQALPYKSLFQPSTATATAAATNFPTASPLTQLPFTGQLVLGTHHARNNGGDGINHDDETVDIKSKVSQNPVIVIGRRGCCMTHVVKRLLLTLGVNPALHEMADDKEEEAVSNQLRVLVAMSSSAGLGDGGARLQFPAVFIGGKLFGGLDRVMATHINGELTPILKEAGALWL